MPPAASIPEEEAGGGAALLVAAQFHHANVVEQLAVCGANVNINGGPEHHQRATPLCLAVSPIHPDLPPRDPDPNGARQLNTVCTLLRLGAGTLPCPPRLPLCPCTPLLR
jgi:hypothetical protein